MHQAAAQLVAGALLGFGDIGRDAQIDLAPARMSGRRPGLAVFPDRRDQLGEGAVPHRDKDRAAEPADRCKGVGAGGGDADRRIRLLERLRHQGDVVEAVVFALVGERVPGPGPLDDLQRFGEALAALGVGDAVILVGAHHAAASDPEDQPAAAQLVDRRGLLGQPQRVAQRQYLDRDADLDPPGAHRDRIGDAERGRHHRSPRLAVQFGKPHRVEAPAVGGLDLRQRLLEGVRLAAPFERRKLVKHAEFHGLFPCSCRLRVLVVFGRS